MAMLVLKRDSFDFTKIIGISAFAVCIFSSFLFNAGSAIWEKQLHGPSFHLTCLTAGAILFFTWFVKPGAISVNVLDVFVLIFIGYMLLRTIQNSFPFVNQSQFYTYLSYAIIYILVRTIYKPGNFGQEIIFVILSVGVLNVFVGVLQLLKIIPISNSLQIVSGLFVNPGSLGGFIACILPLTLTIKISTNKIQSIRGTLILLFAITLILSSSRTAWIASAVPFIIYYVPWSKLIRNRHVWIYLAMILCLAAFLLYELYLLNPLSVQGRLLIWKVGFQMFLEKPFFGHAAGAFTTNYNSFQGAYFASSMGTASEKILAATVHTPFNEYLKIMIEGGLIGLFSFTMIIVQLARTIRHMKPQYILVFLSILSVLIFSLFSYPFAVESNGSIFFALLALVPAKTIAVKSIAPKVAWLIIPIYILLSIPTFRFIYSIKQWRVASSMWDYNEYRALQDYNRIAKDLSSNWSFMYNYGAELLRHGHTTEAIKILTKCRKLGDNVMVNNQLGQAYGNIGHYKQSELFFTRSTNMVPGMLSQKFALFKLYEKTGNWKRYFEIADEIERTPIKIKNPEALLIKNETQSSILKYKKKKNEKQI
jgi:O-antigen polymerase